MTNMQLAKLIEKHKKSLARERDKLRDLLNEVEELEYLSEEAVGSLEAAVSKLSEQV